MGRRKIEIKAIDDDRNRHVTFHKRKSGLLKKLMELSILCKSDVVMLCYFDEKWYEFSSKKNTLDIVERFSERSEHPHERYCNEDYIEKYVEKSKTNSKQYVSAGEKMRSNWRPTPSLHSGKSSSSSHSTPGSVPTILTPGAFNPGVGAPITSGSGHVVGSSRQVGTLGSATTQLGPGNVGNVTDVALSPMINLPPINENRSNGMQNHQRRSKRKSIQDPVPRPKKRKRIQSRGPPVPGLPLSIPQTKAKQMERHGLASNPSPISTSSETASNSSLPMQTPTLPSHANTPALSNFSGVGITPNVLPTPLGLGSTPIKENPVGLLGTPQGFKSLTSNPTSSATGSAITPLGTTPTLFRNDASSAWPSHPTDTAAAE